MIKDVKALEEYLAKKALFKCWSDDVDFNPDDAYYGGTETGETWLARYLLKTFFEEDKNECK